MTTSFQMGGYSGGTSLCGYMECSVDKIRARLGPPNGCGDEITRYEWILTVTDGNNQSFTATVYDYKNSPRSEDSTHDWHIGGAESAALSCRDIVDAVKQIVLN